MKRDTDINNNSNKVDKIKRTSQANIGNKTRTIPVLHHKKSYDDLEEALGLTGQKFHEIFNSHDFISSERIDKLSRQKFDHLVPSLYLTLTGEDTLKNDKVYLTIFNSLMREQMDMKKDQIDKLDMESKKILREDIEEIQSFLINLPTMIDTKMKSIIIFKSNDQLNFVVNMLRPLRRKNIFVIDSSPYVMPLLEILNEETRILIAHLSKDTTEFYTYLLGRIQYVDKLDFPTGYQKVNVKAERSAGKAQDYLQTQQNYFFKDIANEVSRFIKAGYEGVVFTGDEILIKQFKEHLSSELEKQVFGEVPFNPENSVLDMKDDIDGLISQREAQRERFELERLAEAAGTNQAAIGIESVLKAQNRFLTRDLFVNPSQIIKGYRCPDHEYLSIEKKKCRLCQKDLVGVRNVVEDLLEIGNAYKVNIHVISHSYESMDKYHGVAAIIYENEAV